MEPAIKVKGSVGTSVVVGAKTCDLVYVFDRYWAVDPDTNRTVVRGGFNSMEAVKAEYEMTNAC